MDYTLQQNAWVRNSGGYQGQLATDGATVWTFTDADNTVETYDYNTGRLKSVRTQWSYLQNLNYDANGNLTSVSDSHGRQLSFTYTNGVLRTMTDPNGNVYTYSFDTPLVTPLLQSAPIRLISVAYPASTSTLPTIQYVYKDPNNPLFLTGMIDENGNRFATFG